MPMTLAKQREYQRQRRKRMLAKGVCVYCGRYRPRKENRVCTRCLKQFRQRLRDMKELVIRAYGGECSCCGESTYEFLSIDHKRNDGAAERRKFGKKLHPGFGILRFIIKKKFPKRYQLLCYNCNMAKGFFGRCPHDHKIRNH